MYHFYNDGKIIFPAMLFKCSALTILIYFNVICKLLSVSQFSQLCS